MKILTPIIASLALFSTAIFAKDGIFVSAVIHESDQPVRLNLAARQWIKITNFTQNGGSSPAAVSVFQGAAGLAGINVLYASDPTTTQVSHEDVFIGGPAIVYVSPVTEATLCLTYQKGSD